MRNRESIELLEKALEYQKNGDLPNAIEYCSLAHEANPYNKEIYRVLGRSYLGIGQYKYAMRGLLTCAHYTLFDGNINMKSYQDAVDSNNYNWYGNLNNNIKITKDLYLNAVVTDFNFSKVIADIDLMSDIGVCYLTKNQDIIIYNKIPKDLIMDDMRVMQNRPYQHTPLRESQFAPLVRNIGLAFFLTNILVNPKFELENIVNIYFSDDFSVDDLT